jgi:methyl-accepting chemotaxis protein
MLNGLIQKVSLLKGGRDRLRLYIFLFGAIQFGFQMLGVLSVNSIGKVPLLMLEFVSIVVWVKFLGYIRRIDGEVLLVDKDDIQMEKAQTALDSETAVSVLGSGSSKGQIPSEQVDRPPESPAQVSPPVDYASDELSQRIDWDTLMRNAQDGGANSVLACRILEKTTRLVADGSKQVVQMVEAANGMKKNTVQLEAISKDIKGLSDQARIVSINASIEAARAGIHGRVFAVVTSQMKDLSSLVAAMTIPINERLADVAFKIDQNKMLCGTVSGLFVSMTKEVNEFKNLMLRVEELARIQGTQLKSLEEKLTASREKMRKGR